VTTLDPALNPALERQLLDYFATRAQQRGRAVYATWASMTTLERRLVRLAAATGYHAGLYYFAKPLIASGVNRIDVQVPPRDQIMIDMIYGLCGPQMLRILRNHWPTRRARKLTREAAVMAFVLGATHGPFRDENTPLTSGQVVSEVIEHCRSFPDLYGAIGHLDRKGCRS
jgi:hypothetical protein